MNPSLSRRNWTILSWNIREINSQEKWDAIRSKIFESNCDVICLQETKESFDANYLKKLCPPRLNCFEFLPFVGNSGGSIIILAW